MRVGIDGACWVNRRGYGRFARELVTHLAALDGGVDYTLMVDFDVAEAAAVPDRIGVVRVHTRRPAAHAAAAAGRRSLPDLWAMSRAISRERFDLVFFPSAYTYVPVTGRARVAVVIHDIIAEQFPQHVFPTRRAATLWRFKLLAARWQADLVMTVSDASRQGIARRFRMAADRIAMISEAADPIFRALPHDEEMKTILGRRGLLARRFLLYVGGISPHKNLGLLLDAFAALRRQPSYADYRLVLAGDFSGDVFYSAYDALRRRAAALELADAVIFAGHVEDRELAYLYSAAEVFVLPSLWEGFGLPAVEAMACGAPVVASARGALPEVVGAAGVLFDPDQPAALQAALRRVLTDADLRARLRRLGPQRAAQFSWDRAARETLSAFHRLAAGA
ncbi:MAG: glycosyltransferase family 4 protein [Candidatus Binatia bacterium]